MNEKQKDKTPIAKTEYQPEIWAIPKDTICAARNAIEATLPSAACSALEKIRRQIGRLETHARIKYPGDPTPEQCTIMARELTDAADTLENEVRQLWKLRCEVGNCPWVVSQNAHVEPAAARSTHQNQ